MLSPVLPFLFVRKANLSSGFSCTPPPLPLPYKSFIAGVVIVHKLKTQNTEIPHSAVRNTDFSLNTEILSARY